MGLGAADFDKEQFQLTGDEGNFVLDPMGYFDSQGYGDEEEEEDSSAEAVIESAARGSSMAAAHLVIEEKKKQLLESKVTHFGITFSDGKNMVAVKNAITNLSRVFSGSLPKDKQAFMGALDQLRLAYHTVIDSCRNFVTYIESKGKGQGEVGSLRLELTKEILEQSINELSFFEMPASDLFIQLKSTESWERALFDARAQSLSDRDANITKMGAGTSTIYRKEEEDTAGIEAGEAISNRNVSTSRMANRLGMSGMIAKSETVLIRKDDGLVVRTNSMEGVKGMTMGELEQYANAEGITLKLSDNAIKQLYQLQVFDLICGQIDRHMNNYIPSYEVTGENEYTITSVKGIDNDLSFGPLLTSVRGHGQQKGFIDKMGRITIPFLPKDFYDSVMAYTPWMARYDQMDIRSQAEIEALGLRITETQRELTQLVSEGKVKLLNSEGEWEEARDEIIEMQRQRKLGNSYVPIQMIK